MHDILISKDSKGKTRIVELECKWCNSLHGFIIVRTAQQWKGKVTNQPLIEIKQGKAKRTVTEQAKLEYSSHLKKYLDKGYKNISEFGLTEISTIEDPGKYLSDVTTDSNGAPKPMLAKKYDDVSPNTFNKTFWASTKIDGTRCLMHWDNGKIITSSRGGDNYDIPTTYIRQDEMLQKWCKEHPDMWLDGELYIHGLPLSYISGLVRLKTLNNKHKDLCYYIYDIVCVDKPFSERLSILNDLKNILSVDSNVHIVHHVSVTGWDNIIKLHNKYVDEGWEGLVIRDPSKEYKCNGRDNRMIKIKQFEDHEYKIVGLVEGLRDEDMCFAMETKEGYPFKAKPIGDRELKQWYRKHINSLIGQLGTIKHFGMTKTDQPVPNLPIFKTVRYSDDL